MKAILITGEAIKTNPDQTLSIQRFGVDTYRAVPPNVPTASLLLEGCVCIAVEPGVDDRMIYGPNMANWNREHQLCIRLRQDQSAADAAPPVTGKFSFKTATSVALVSFKHLFRLPARGDYNVIVEVDGTQLDARLIRVW